MALTCLALRVGPGVALAQSAPRLESQEKWSNVFGDKESVFHWVVTSDQAWSGTAGWRFSRDARTLASGESAVSVRPGQPEVVAVRVAAPSVNEGVVIDALLTVTLLESGRAVTNAGKPIRIFAEDPFAQRKAWCKERKIRLFDPEGKTAGVFEAHGVPFDPVRNVEALAGAEGSTLIVGEGVSFRDYRGLWALLVRSAAAGAPVICLSPSEGELAASGTDEPFVGSPAALHFRKNDVIGELDKRLDFRSWPPDGVVARHSLILKGERGPLRAEMVADDGGWTWMEASWGEAGGRLVLCTFGIVERWNDSPAPRYLLLKMLEAVSAEGRSEP